MRLTDLQMTCDPVDVGHAGESVVVVDVEGVFDGHSGAEEVSTSRVDDALGFAGRARGL